MTLEYTVTWSIDIDAESFEDAAQIALEIQRDPNSIASHFVVEDARGVVRELDIDCPRVVDPEGK